jgi:hypothetical protein
MVLPLWARSYLLQRGGVVGSAVVREEVLGSPVDGVGGKDSTGYFVGSSIGSEVNGSSVVARS